MWELTAQGEVGNYKNSRYSCEGTCFFLHKICGLQSNRKLRSTVKQPMGCAATQATLFIGVVGALFLCQGFTLGLGVKCILLFLAATAPTAIIQK